MFIEAKDDGSASDNWSYKSYKAPDESPPTNQHPVFTGRMPFLSPNQQCQSTEGKLQYSKFELLLTNSLNCNKFKLTQFLAIFLPIHNIGLLGLTSCTLEAM